MLFFPMLCVLLAPILSSDVCLYVLLTFAAQTDSQQTVYTSKWQGFLSIYLLTFLYCFSACFIGKHI